MVNPTRQAPKRIKTQAEIAKIESQTKPPRKVIALCNWAGLVALCDDGTIWHRTDEDWEASETWVQMKGPPKR